MKKTGAEIIVDALEKEGVEIMFGFPGGSVIELGDYLNRSKKIKFILTRHEQAAAHAADGYARATGKVGVCLATSGPGATNLVTGIATAYLDSIPMVAITGQVATAKIGNDAFQEADMVGITRPITKHNYLVKDINDLPRILKEAFYIARTGRPGPVLVDIPSDIQKASMEYEYPKSVDIRGYKPIYEGNLNQITKAAHAIEKAQRPLIYAGGGVILSGAEKELFELATKCDIPVTTTLLGLGAFPETHPLAMEMLGMHGTQYANYAMDETDLIIAVGARFEDRVTGKLELFAPNAKNIIHIDIDSSSISKNIIVDIPVVGDCKSVLAELLKLVKPKKHDEWIKQVIQWKKNHPLVYKDDTDFIKPQFVIEKIYEATKGDAIIVTEVGQHQMWTAQHYKFTKPRQFLSSGGLGTMGFGFPAAIGAQFACPKKTVFDIAGDGSIQMNIQELATAVINKLPVNIAILNNGCLGMVRQWQDLFYKKHYAFTPLTPDKSVMTKDTCYIPDFVKVAEAYGALGIRVKNKADVLPAIKEAIKSPKTVVLDFIVEPEENVYPMIPANASVKQMMGGMA